jgi:hypothetical protein
MTVIDKLLIPAGMVASHDEDKGRTVLTRQRLLDDAAAALIAVSRAPR